ncbi:pentatricopeptide repeat-containing protein At5g39680 [Typha angustifolia]|uniref:pentatricopeptide repeat-containing protein At5g39680 n=1 Tax=Typha angustifolia TaxID=59011 RepID=UPI003C2F5C59
MQTHRPRINALCIFFRNLSLSHFQPMQPFAPYRRRNITSLLKLATEFRELNLGKTIHAHVIKTLEFDVIRTNYLINLYAKCGHLGIARQVFDGMPKRNVVSGNALMTGYFHAGLAKDALELFKSMDFSQPGSAPNEYIFTTILASCADIGAHEEGQQCHGYVLKSGLVFHTHVRNALLHMYSKCSSMKDALHVFDTLQGFDVFAFNSMISGFLDHGRLTDAMNLLNCMVKRVAQWDHVSYVAVLGLCADSKDLRLGQQIHGQILKRRIDSSFFVNSALIDKYGKCGDVRSAQCAFVGLPEKNVVSWTAVMAAFSQNEYFEEALKLFLEMEITGIRPNEFTFAVALNSSAGLSALRNGDALNAHAEKTGYKAHLTVGNALINMYCKSGSIEDAKKIFMSMSCRDIVSWNSIITGYSNHGFAREALRAFQDMLIEAKVPSYITFIGVLSACAHLGLVDEGFHYLNHLMKDIGITPGVEHYTCMVGTLCRVGKLDEAERFMRHTCTEWDVIAWRTLLSACEVHRNYRLGYQVAEHILHLNPNDVGTHLLLSNMYAKANRWDGVVKIRKLMRERYIKKEPGVSWIQVGREVHVFTSEDKNHSWMNQISKKLSALIDQIKLIGYVPNIAAVLHDVEDQQKEECLRYHSEKLAVAFGLLCTPQGAPIHVMKNLRICDDCHVAIKLISVVTNRRLIVRDANRFHCIENGICSCDDYW